MHLWGQARGPALSSAAPKATLSSLTKMLTEFVRRDLAEKALAAARSS